MICHLLTAWIWAIFDSEEESLHHGGKLKGCPSGITHFLNETPFHCGVRYELKGIRRDRSTYHHWRQHVLTYCENEITDYSTVPVMRRNRAVTWWVVATGHVDRKSRAGVSNIDGINYGTQKLWVSNKYD